MLPVLMSLVKGVYDLLVTDSVRAKLEALPPNLEAVVQTLDLQDLTEYLAREILLRTREQLRFTDDVDQAISQTVKAIQQLGKDELIEACVLAAVKDKVGTVTLPEIPLAHNALVTNESKVNYAHILRKELASADRVDVICPFIGVAGLNLIFKELQELGSRLRVVTTTYLGGTHTRALVRIAETNASVKIAYESRDQKTSLHAKAWIFHRDSGANTATIGSSNISPNALVDGLEWNVRVSAIESPQLFEGLKSTFERLWNDPQFEDFDPARDTERLTSSLKAQRSSNPVAVFFADLAPHPHQAEALAELQFARLEGRRENLVVAATGTGKTLLAAFDYKRLCETAKGRLKLLFIAHRGDILEQSLGAFRAVLRDKEFGELNVGQDKADDWKYVFASIQSFSEKKLNEFSADHFDVIIVDEFHHAEARTYQRLLDHFQPSQLLGLTATPERTDGRSVIDRFGVPTFELRLWHALERNLLCPFHYYGIDDKTNLSSASFISGKYVDSELEKEFLERGDERVRIILHELQEKAPELDGLRAVAFCATIRHADYMAKQFVSAGYVAVALHSGRSAEDRDRIMSQFRKGEIQIVCTVDLFNEGIDVPEINTVLFLRPTESSTVFIQQLGRGLRKHSDKGALTVLDFVGQQNRKFRWDLRYRAITGQTRMELQRAISDEFPQLPAGCNIRLDKATQKHILDGIKNGIPTNKRAMIDEIRRLVAAGKEITVSSFIRESGVELSDLYRGHSLHHLLVSAGVENAEDEAVKRVSSFIHLNDALRIDGYRIALREAKESVWSRMISFPLSRSMDVSEIAPRVRQEMLELLDYLAKYALQRPALAADLPFVIGMDYSRDEIVSPFRDNPESMRQGTFYVREAELDIHLVTLKKTERNFSPSTMYQDYFIDPSKLHWESQSTTSALSATGQRLILGEGRHLFFVRSEKSSIGGVGPVPFTCVGFAKPISNEGERPITLIWKLETPVTDHTWVRFKAASG